MPVDTLPTTGGFKVKHLTKRNAFEVITDFQRPFLGDTSTFHKCPACQVVHYHKTYHIMLNGDGFAVLSPQVYRGVMAAGMGGLLLVDHTDTPPTVVLGTKDGAMAPVPQRDTTVIYHE